MANNKFDKSDFVGRFQELLTYLNEKPTPLAEKIGISRAFMNDVLHLRSGPSVQMMYGITNYRSDINIRWLLTGNGDMLLKDESKVEEQRLLAEYWQTNYNLLETAVKISHKRVEESSGREQAEEIFKEVLQAQKPEAMPEPTKKKID